jgi:hypothetical protein
MRYPKLNPILSLRVPLTSIESVDYIFYRGKDLDWAFKRASDWLGCELEALGPWQVREHGNKTFNYLKIRAINFWPGLGPCPVDQSIGCMEVEHDASRI